jgi:hypothetical protein
MAWHTDLNIPKQLEESLPIAFNNASTEMDMIVTNGKTSLHLSGSEVKRRAYIKL